MVDTTLVLRNFGAFYKTGSATPYCVADLKIYSPYKYRVSDTSRTPSIARTVAENVRIFAAAFNVPQNAVGHALGLSKSAISKRWNGDQDYRPRESPPSALPPPTSGVGVAQRRRELGQMRG